MASIRTARRFTLCLGYMLKEAIHNSMINAVVSVLTFNNDLDADVQFFDRDLET